MFPKHARFTTSWVQCCPLSLHIQKNLFHPCHFQPSSVYGPETVSSLDEDPWLANTSLMTSLFFTIIFQHFLTAVRYYATRKWTRAVNIPWYWTSVINIKYFLFVPASDFPNNPQAGFRSQNIPGTILNKQFACHLLVLEIKTVY